MDNLSPLVLSCAAAPLRPQPPTSARRPLQLDDAKWLARRYSRDTDETIALELGVDRKTVRAARRRHGIPSRARGPRRGQPPALTLVGPASTHTGRPAVLDQVEVRYAADDLHGIPPTENQILERVKVLLAARLEHDRPAGADAAISLAAAAARLAHQLTNS